jgi:nucleoside-diphosphate-sugar epimerase
MKHIQMTGGSGFVGQNFVKYFTSKGDRVTNITRSELREISFVGECDVFIHLAGKAHDLKKSSDENDYYEINTELTKKIYDLYLSSNIKTFIYFSSVKAVADSVDGTLTEDIIPDPLTSYGLSKLYAEEYLLSKHLPPDKRLFIIRPCMIHGPGNKGNLNLLYQLVSKRIPYPLASFINKRSFLSISNLCFIIDKLIMDPAIPGGIYNVADDESLSTNDLIKVIAETLGQTPKLWAVNSNVIRTISQLGDRLYLPLNSERLKKLTESYIVSNEKIKKTLNISALPTSSRDGLTATIRSFRRS